MRVVFVDNLLLEQKNGTYRFDLQPHLGLISLIAVAEAAGHEGILYDPKLALAREQLPLDRTLYAELANAILAYSPDVVGLTTLGCNFICTVKVATHLKRIAGEVPILLGGPHASILDREIIARWPQFDAVVRNEAEPTLVRVLEATHMREFADIPGVTFRAGRDVVANVSPALVADLDTLPWPAYDRYPIEELDLSLLRVEAGRGCPFSCTFCSTASFFGRKYRVKSAGRLRAELDNLHEEYGISRFALTHDLFTVNKAKVREFCEEVQDRGYSWTCSARMDCVDASLLEQMRAAGCSSIYYGVETGSPRMQKIVDKRLDLAIFFPTLESTRQVGIAATASFITGYPEEEQADQDQTLDLIGSCFYDCVDSLTIQLHLLTPEPGTRLIQEFGDQLEYDGHITDFNFPTLEADDALIMRQNPAVFMNHHYYRTQIPRQRHVLVTSVYHVLYRLGFPVLRQLLAGYDRSLSCLLGSMAAWAERNGENGPYDAEFVCRFLGGSLGREHYLTSLVRYMLAAADLRREASEPAYSSVTLRQREPRYVLSSSAVVLRDLHDCPSILSMIAADPSSPIELPSSLQSRRGDYLLVLDERGEKAVRNFELDDATATFVERFRRPTSLRGIGADDREAARPLVDELVGLGVLRSAARRVG